jgi:hypothetical protein
MNQVDVRTTNTKVAPNLGSWDRADSPWSPMTPSTAWEAFVKISHAPLARGIVAFPGIGKRAGTDT